MLKFLKIISGGVFILTIFYSLGFCDAQAYFDSGVNYFQQRKSSDALNDFQYVVDNYPDDPLAPESLFRIGACYAMMNNLTASEESLEDVISKYPTTEQAEHAYFLIGCNYLVIRDTESAINWLEQRVEKYPEKKLETGQAYFQLGLAYYRKGDYNNALAAYHKIVNDYPSWGVVSLHMIDEEIGRCYQAKGKYNEAINSYYIAVTSGTQGAVYKDVTTFNIGECYEGEGDYTHAKIWYQKVIDNYPGSEYIPAAKSKLEELKSK